MDTTLLELIQEIDLMWDPVYPYLSQHIQELYGRTDGSVLEMGPFCGVIFSLPQRGMGTSFSIGTFPRGMGTFFRHEVRRRDLEGRVEVLEIDPSLKGIGESRYDLVIFRGAFFFPSLFNADLKAIFRILRPQGVGFIGGGFGKYTPEAVINAMAKPSRDVNDRIGKVDMDESALRKAIEESGLSGKVEVTAEGGLWAVIRK